VNASPIFVAVSIVVLAIVALLAFFIAGRRRENRLTPLAGLAFGFVLAGILFGEDRVVGYGLLGTGVVLAILDMYRRSRNR